jgi:hypothetical protein
MQTVISRVDEATYKLTVTGGGVNCWYAEDGAPVVALCYRENEYRIISLQHSPLKVVINGTKVIEIVGLFSQAEHVDPLDEYGMEQSITFDFYGKKPRHEPISRSFHEHDTDTVLTSGGLRFRDQTFRVPLSVEDDSTICDFCAVPCVCDSFTFKKYCPEDF